MFITLRVGDSKIRVGLSCVSGKMTYNDLSGGWELLTQEFWNFEFPNKQEIITLCAMKWW